MSSINQPFLFKILPDHKRLNQEKALSSPKLDQHGQAYATGSRKDAIARVWVKPGSGKITVNEKEFAAYFTRPVLQMILKQPIIAANCDGRFDVIVRAIGGGLSAQAAAVRHGIAKALTYYDPSLRAVLKEGGFLTRDTRVVKRQKYGKAKARRSFSFSSRTHQADATPQQHEIAINVVPPVKAASAPINDTALHELAALSGKELVSEMKTWGNFDDGIARLGKFLERSK